MPDTEDPEPALKDKSVRAWLAAGRPESGETRRLLALARPHVVDISAALVLMIVGTAATLAVPWLMANLLNHVLDDDGTSAMRLLNRTTAVVVGLYVLRAACTGVQSFLLARAGENVVLRLRSRLYDHVTSLEPAFFDKHSVGEIVSRTMSDVALVQAVVTRDIAALLASLLTMAGATSLLLVASWRLAVIVLLLVPPVLLAGRLYARRMHTYGIRIQDLFAAATQIVQETVSAIRMVQSFVREPFERARFSESAGELAEASIGRSRTQAMFGASVALLTSLAIVGALWFGGREVVLGRLQVGDLVAFVAYSSMIASSASNVIGLYGRWSSALGASRRVFQLLDRPPAVADRPDAAPLLTAEGAIGFHGVSFAYGRAGPVLHDIDLLVESGETLALVGPSGAGKSTMMHLIARFYDPLDGWLSLDGRDLRETTLSSLRGYIGLVPQETVLFNASVGDNIRYGRLEASESELQVAAQAANADSFIDALPDGYGTMVGERGMRLSAGERQRVAIARALLKDPRVLLLDEATSSLDSESERAVQSAFERLLTGRTSVVIAHRLSTVRRADRIVVLDGGRIVEVGRHEQLLERSGLYARLYELQFRDDAPEGPV